ncbi:hypothetical protein [Lysobacter antibioticus]|uniref:hypothetical protein n=1 Tax=Lysobacter antibioticus TaxID=84531 RepID=UPI00126A3174|nr:hypothetical protein [Lysobacter antibioticus]
MKRSIFVLAAATLLSSVAFAQTRQEPIASHYAAERGVTTAEASRRLSHVDEALKVKEAAEAKYPDTFGGLYIQHEPTYRVIVKFSRDAESSLRSLTADVAFVPVKSAYSIRDLEKKATQVATILKDKGIQCSTNVDPKESTVVVWLDKADVDSARAKLVGEGLDLTVVQFFPYEKVELTKNN